MSKRQLLQIDAWLDGVTGTVRIPAIAEVSYRIPSKYRRGQSDVARSWTFVGKYLEVAMQEYEANAEIDFQDRLAERHA